MCTWYTALRERKRKGRARKEESEKEGGRERESTTRGTLIALRSITMYRPTRTCSIV